ncbi:MULTISPECIES: tyrosine-type recombinase/integrase [unclassified Bradyrhizobium]|uniref:tyrosine-type recombinase/integrase n=1 Tax=unclassified Bradyrhizobium TaxID=2631580 RepID=UPI0028E2EAC5|nr:MULTISPECIES: integrase arm-type DNA-binding domain-containing protein [unclassified Bradyrhizobium]
MASGKLTDAAVRNAKASGRLVKLSDGGGLQLWLTPSGGKLWNFAYRFGSKQKKLALGEYGKAPAGVPLEAARRLRDEAAGLLRDGIDPAIRKRQVKAARAEAQANTFSVLADELLAKKKREGVATATAGKLEWLLGLAKADLGPLPIGDVSAGEVLRVLQPLEAAGKLETAKRLRAVIGAVFRYAVTTARANADPTQALRGAIAAPRPKHRAAIIEPVAFGGLLRAIDGFQGQPTTKAALQLIALLAPRPGELRHATWAEFDLDAAVWNIPAERTKMRRPHRVPLPAQATAILRDLHPITGRGVAGLVFPGLRSVTRPISENTLCAALRRLGYSNDEMVAHGFRSTFSTLANESGKWSINAIEAALAHVEPNAVRRAYVRGDYWDERVKLMTWWADYLDALRQGARILQFKEASA